MILIFCLLLRTDIVGKPVDMWAFGIIVFILLGGYPPFADPDQKQLFKKIVKGEFEFHPEYWGTVSENAKDLIRGCICVDPEARLTVTGVRAHPWLQEDSAVLAARTLEANQAALRKYQALKKLKAGAKAVMAINLMKKLGAAKKASAGADAAAVDSGDIDISFGTDGADYEA